VRLLFTITLFVSAALLFSVQPLIAKMLLPLLGGSPAVWNTCMVFFQSLLLAGYLYAHAATTWLGPRRQAPLHVGLLLLPVVVLPLAVSPGWLPPADANPIPWLLALLLVSVGLPFFMVATSAPLLQKWFARTGHPGGRDPYFLYAASNLGSLLALLSYPLLLEPYLRLAEQSWLWSSAYGLLVLLTTACAVVVWRAPARAPGGEGPQTTAEPGGAGPPERLAPGRRLRWVALAFVPSSLMLGVTTHLSTDIAALPLLWVLPLALYLLSFILVFARRPPLPRRLAERAFPMAVVLSALFFCLEALNPLWVPLYLDIPLHLLTFFVVAVGCHGELAGDRPPERHLTEFYLWMASGGVLGGLFNALIAPVVFDRVVEYPLALVLAALLQPRAGAPAERPLSRWLDLALPLGLAALAAVLFASLSAFRFSSTAPSNVLAGLFLLLCYTFEGRPIRFALGVGGVLLASALSPGHSGQTLYRERSFFGVLRVAHDPTGQYRQLIHGTTLHGQQSLDPARRDEPLTYYHRTGPAGQVLEVFQQRPAKPSVGVVGLGAGSLACYARAEQDWTFYEIDPSVERIARDPRFFTYLQDCRAGGLRVVLGDARLRLREEPDRRHGLIILDAFSSDAIPIHLLTREALGL
jgi:hypothetical protein